MQIGNHVYAGTYQDTIATSLFFTHDEKTEQEEESVDPVFGHQLPVKVQYLDSTRKKLTLKRVFLKTKQQPPSNCQEAQQQAAVATQSSDFLDNCSVDKNSGSDKPENQVTTTTTT